METEQAAGLARPLQGSRHAHPSFLVPKTFCVPVEAIGLRLQSAQLLLLFREGGTKGCSGALQLQDGFVAVLSVLVNGRAGNGRFWFFSSAVFPATFPELFYFMLFLMSLRSLPPVQCCTWAGAGSVYRHPGCLCQAHAGAHYEANTDYVNSHSPAVLAHLLGFADLLSQVLFLAVEVTLGDTFLICFILTLSTNRYRLSMRNRCLHITNHLLLLLHQLAVADLPFVKI